MDVVCGPEHKKQKCVSVNQPFTVPVGKEKIK